MKCVLCVVALDSTDRTAHDFVALVDRGNLTRPSPSAIAVCMESEKVFQRLLRISGNTLPKDRNVQDKVASVVLDNTSDSNLFPELHEHQFDAAVEDNHVHLLVKRIASFYTRSTELCLIWSFGSIS